MSDSTPPTDTELAEWQAACVRLASFYDGTMPDSDEATGADGYRFTGQYSTDVQTLLCHVANLTADNERLREALKPFAQMCKELDRPNLADGWLIYDELERYDGHTLWTMGHLRAARAALAGRGEGT